MATLRLIVFKVSRGLCVFLKTPNSYGVMIDCGRDYNFSPACWIANNLSTTLNYYNERLLSWFVVTHPHDDHVADIANVRKYLPPAILVRHKNYDWSQVLNPPDGDPSLNAEKYHAWQQTYNQPVLVEPNLGCAFQRFALSPREASQLNTGSQHILNNSSFVCVFTWPCSSYGLWKVVVCGDNEINGLRTLLKIGQFREAVRGAHFFITPHHGHNSGFCPELFEVMGKPLCNITSERAGDSSVAREYSTLARGVKFRGETRCHLTTRCDGHISVTMGDDLDFRFNWE